VREGDYVIDIGANIGVYSKLLSELVGSDGRVYSIEPFPTTFEILCHNLTKLGLDNVEVLNIAISDSEAVVTMGLPRDPSGTETHYRVHIVDSDTDSEEVETVKVQAATIDSRFLEVADEISFVKCDVEGHELACLRGSEKFLAKCQAAWLIEVSGDPDIVNSSAHRVFATLSERGYGAWWFDGTRLRKRATGDKSTNYFFLMEEHVNFLKGCGDELLLRRT